MEPFQTLARLKERGTLRRIGQGYQQRGATATDARRAQCATSKHPCCAQSAPGAEVVPAIASIESTQPLVQHRMIPMRCCTRASEDGAAPTTFANAGGLSC